MDSSHSSQSIPRWKLNVDQVGGDRTFPFDPTTLTAQVVILDRKWKEAGATHMKSRVIRSDPITGTLHRTQDGFTQSVPVEVTYSLCLSIESDSRDGHAQVKCTREQTARSQKRGSDSSRSTARSSRDKSGLDDEKLRQNAGVWDSIIPITKMSTPPQSPTSTAFRLENSVNSKEKLLLATFTEQGAIDWQSVSDVERIFVREFGSTPTMAQTLQSVRSLRYEMPVHRLRTLDVRFPNAPSTQWPKVWKENEQLYWHQNSVILEKWLDIGIDGEIV